ncbi:L-gulonolactone oxidase [Fulvia fulva]|uniref:D-arabinono-1,4-lactone oxidase n=1 Tax=Passalora fulva TaxID=5499 RepID=A0A9Q8UTN4_PASFU|nr:L-gulonolactone oxidase [Fulvia fulva]KAK4613680.1 L-gulonolactone oxidase [Fulvia fulva]KAK4614803.1 L-gulonolactone oxidase [Fulvia fulva]UJO21972.1 L-gulonolactone oxidase [Fulvia fulva]WPV20331.1 L-gulonolactone oxidase [Fulvia fulva]WPV34920.1 L-gulonolactone oxidase [Fulvia fulva]
MPTLVNWNDEIKFSVAKGKLKTPSSIEEVQEIVKEAHANHAKVKAIGAMHSITPCFVGSDIIVSTDKLNKILSIDKDHGTVTVQAGVSINQLCEYLKPLGYQPPVILEWGNFHYGAISGTHANDSSLADGAQVSSFVLGVKLVKSDGQLLEISETQNAQYLPAIRSHFGLFGVVCEVTLRIWPIRSLLFTYETQSIEKFTGDFEGQMQKLRSSADQSFALLFQNVDTILIQKRKFQDVDKRPPHPLTNSLESKAINLFTSLVLPATQALAGLQLSAKHAEGLSNFLVKGPLDALRGSEFVINPNDRGILYAEDDPNFEFHDWAFPEEKWPGMVRAYRELLDRFREERDFLITLPTIVYFIQKDDRSLLSRSRNSDMVVVDPEHHDPKDPRWKAFRKAFGELAIQHGGIPHINKTVEAAQIWYAKACDQEALKEYLELRKQFDPDGMFLNDFFEKLFEG